MDDLRADSLSGNRDAFLMSRMLIPISADEAQVMCERNNISGKLNNTHPHHKCKWWAEETGTCRSYGNRPSMCRKYPYSQPCVHCGETNDELERRV